MGAMGSVVLAPDRAAAEIARLRQRMAGDGYDLSVRLWDGTPLGPDDAGYRLVLRQPWTLRALFPPDDLRAGEVYLADGLDVEGSMIAALHAVRGLQTGIGPAHKLAMAALAVRLPAPPPGLGDGRVNLAGRVHGRARDAAAVRHHYDVGNDFYALLLDDRLVYSCAYFTDEDAVAPGDRGALARAQWRKLDLICRKLDLRPGERFLDIGCGWGALVMHAAAQYGVQATGVTLSPRQAELARDRIAAAGLGDRVRIEVRDYRDLTGTYDAIASVGMVEHVGARQLPRYAATLRTLLGAGGRVLNHGITTGRRDVVRDFARHRDTFVGRYVFPDGALVPAHHMVRVLEQSGFEIHDLEQLRPHYERTLAHWVANLEASYDRARALVGARTARVWRAYLAGSAVGFAVGDLGVVQVLATAGRAALPLDRRRMLLAASMDTPEPA
jgi:cyclopropane-fatty-acyl-phospholipid synthase